LQHAQLTDQLEFGRESLLRLMSMPSTLLEAGLPSPLQPEPLRLLEKVEALAMSLTKSRAVRCFVVEGAFDQDSARLWALSREQVSGLQV
jgi:hypothetical protein